MTDQPRESLEHHFPSDLVELVLSYGVRSLDEELGCELDQVHRRQFTEHQQYMLQSIQAGSFSYPLYVPKSNKYVSEWVEQMQQQGVRYWLGKLSWSHLSGTRLYRDSLSAHVLRLEAELQRAARHSIIEGHDTVEFSHDCEVLDVCKAHMAELFKTQFYDRKNRKFVLILHAVPSGEPLPNLLSEYL